MANFLVKNKIRTITLSTFLIYTLLIFFSTGEDTSYPAAIFTSLYAGGVVAALMYIILNALSYLIGLLRNKFN